MVDREMDKGKRGAFWARMSVEAIVIVLVASATVAIFAMKMVASGLEDSGSPGPNKVVGLRHDAITPAPSDTPPQGVGTAAADQDKSSERSANLDTVVRNGVTVLSPRLLVPVINADAIQMASGLEAPFSPRKAPNVRNQVHYAHRAQTPPGHRRVVRSAPFWRVVAR